MWLQSGIGCLLILEECVNRCSFAPRCPNNSSKLSPTKLHFEFVTDSINGINDLLLGQRAFKLPTQILYVTIDSAIRYVAIIVIDQIE